MMLCLRGFVVELSLVVSSLLNLVSLKLVLLLSELNYVNCERKIN